MALNLHISTNCKSIAEVRSPSQTCWLLVRTFRGQGSNMHSTSQLVQPTRSLVAAAAVDDHHVLCCALYSNDGNNRKNANIICHFLFQHATYHHPSAVKCYILKYKFNSYSLSSVTSASRIILLFLSCRVLFAFRHSAFSACGTRLRSIFYCR